MTLTGAEDFVQPRISYWRAIIDVPTIHGGAIQGRAASRSLTAACLGAHSCPRQL
jgi:hypothetical protein